jgi:hypothetical protein
MTMSSPPLPSLAATPVTPLQLQPLNGSAPALHRLALQKQLRRARVPPDMNGLLHFMGHYASRPGSVLSQVMGVSGKQSQLKLSQWDEWMVQYHLRDIESVLPPVTIQTAAKNGGNLADTSQHRIPQYLALPYLLRAAGQCQSYHLQWQRLARDQQQRPLQQQQQMHLEVKEKKSVYQDCLAYHTCNSDHQIYSRCYVEVTQQVILPMLMQTIRAQQGSQDPATASRNVFDRWMQQHPSALHYICIHERQQLERCIGQVVSLATQQLMETSSQASPISMAPQPLVDLNADLQNDQ